MNIPLPDLAQYKARLVAVGAPEVLKTVSVPAGGLLDSLPRANKGKNGWPWTDQTEPSIYSDITTWPKLTIVTPSYNQGQFIEQTIRSVLLQNYPNLEYIVMDGGSTDNTLQILEKYSHWISYYRSEKDNGQSHAINKGFSLAGGNYYAWINSDDYYLPGTFFKVINRFIKTGARFVYGYVMNYHTRAGRFELVKTPPLLDYFLRMPSLAQPSCFWSASIHQPLWEQLHGSLDFELWQRIVPGNKRSRIKEALSVANIHADAKTSNPGMDAAWAEDHRLICSEDAHGPVDNWNTVTFLNRLWIKIHQLID